MSVLSVRDDDGKFPKYAWPGGYAIAYVADDGEFLCGDCVNNEPEVHFDGDADGWRVDGYTTGDHHDGDDEAWVCAHCGAVIVPAVEITKEET